jgi:hypothetical protein
MDLLTKKELAKAYNILIDLECCMTWQITDKEHINKLNSKFYRYVPHIDTSNLTIIQIYVKKAIIIGKLKDLSWTKNN